MAGITKTPEFIDKLKIAIASKMLGCEFDVERVFPTNSYRLAVMWSGFAKSNIYKRQERVWKIAEKILTDEEILRLSMILTVRPDEVDLVDAGIRPTRQRVGKS